MTLYACAVALPAPQQVLRVSLTCTLLKFNLSISQCKTFAEMTLCVKRLLKLFWNLSCPISSIKEYHLQSLLEGELEQQWTCGG